jgi:hypothetical protein
MRYVIEFGADAAGQVPVFDLFIRLDTTAPIASPSFTELSGGAFYFDFTRSSTDPDVYFQASCSGVPVSGTLSYLDAGGDLGTMPAEVTAIKARTDNLPVNTNTVLATITADLLRALGLLHENSVLDRPTYESGTNNLKTARIRVYDSAANATTARNLSAAGTYTYDTGKLAEYAIAGDYTGDNMVRYLTTKTA